jgi:hypothetical protein
VRTAGRNHGDGGKGERGALSLGSIGHPSRTTHWSRRQQEESYGTVAVLQDLYGNLWDLL